MEKRASRLWEPTCCFLILADFGAWRCEVTSPGWAEDMWKYYACGVGKISFLFNIRVSFQRHLLDSVWLLFLSPSQPQDCYPSDLLKRNTTQEALAGEHKLRASSKWTQVVAWSCWWIVSYQIHRGYGSRFQCMPDKADSTKAHLYHLICTNICMINLKCRHTEIIRTITYWRSLQPQHRIFFLLSEELSPIPLNK